MSIIDKLRRRELLNGAPDWTNSTEYEAIIGSVSYGVSGGNTSDVDVMSIAIPNKELIFPHLNGMVPGFAPQPVLPHVWQRHHIKVEEGTFQEKEYDVTVYNIISFCRLAAENNPNIIDALFVPDRCVVFQSDVGKYIRQNRRMFLHKGAHSKFKGYAYSQLRKLDTRNPTGKRAELVAEHGYDTKFAYHIVRLMQESEQILRTGDLNLEDNKEELKAIRSGDWSLEKLQKWFEDKVSILDKVFLESKLQDGPDWERLNELVMVCLEIKFGSLSQAMVTDEGSKALKKLEDIAKIINR